MNSEVVVEAVMQVKASNLKEIVMKCSSQYVAQNIILLNKTPRKYLLPAFSDLSSLEVNLTTVRLPANLIKRILQVNEIKRVLQSYN